MYRILVYYSKNGKIGRFLKSKKIDDEENPVVDFSLEEALAEIEELFSVGVGVTDLFPRKNVLKLYPSEIMKIEILSRGEAMT